MKFLLNNKWLNVIHIFILSFGNIWLERSEILIKLDFLFTETFNGYRIARYVRDIRICEEMAYVKVCCLSLNGEERNAAIIYAFYKLFGLARCLIWYILMI